MPEGRPEGYSRSRDPNVAGNPLLRDRFHQIRGSGHVNQLADGHLERLATELVQERGAPLTPQNMQIALDYLRGGGISRFGQEQATEAAIADEAIAAESVSGRGVPTSASTSGAPVSVPTTAAPATTPPTSAPPSTSGPPPEISLAETEMGPLPTGTGTGGGGGSVVVPAALGAGAAATTVAADRLMRPPSGSAWEMPLGTGESAIIPGQNASVQRPTPADPDTDRYRLPGRGPHTTGVGTGTPDTGLPVTSPELHRGGDTSGPGIVRDQPEGMERGQFYVDTPQGPYDYTLYLGDDGSYNTVAPDGRRIVARTAQEIEQMLRTGASSTLEPLESRAVSTDDVMGSSSQARATGNVVGGGSTVSPSGEPYDYAIHRDNGTYNAVAPNGQVIRASTQMALRRAIQQAF